MFLSSSVHVTDALRLRAYMNSPQDARRKRFFRQVDHHRPRFCSRFSRCKYKTRKIFLIYNLAVFLTSRKYRPLCASQTATLQFERAQLYMFSQFRICRSRSSKAHLSIKACLVYVRLIRSLQHSWCAMWKTMTKRIDYIVLPLS